MANNEELKEEMTNGDEDEEISFDDIDPIPTEDSDIEEGEYSTTDIPPADLVDLIANQKASEAKSEIFRSLYNKVGERIEGLKSEIRKSSE
jgi:hypothetical protein